MPSTRKTNHCVLVPGLLTLLLGIMALFDGLFGFQSLPLANPHWHSLAPGTALCFILSGLALLKCRKFSDGPVSGAQNVYVWLVLLLAAARAAELASGHDFGVEHLFLARMTPAHAVWPMSPQAVIGFAVFGIAVLTHRQGGNWKIRTLTRTAAGVLLAMGLTIILGQWLNLEYFLAGANIKTDLTWMDLPTAVGMSVLGIGLWGLTLRAKPGSETVTAEQRAKQVYRTTIFMLAATVIATSLAGLRLLDQTVFEQASSNLAQTLGAKEDLFGTTLDNYTQRALLAGTNLATAAAIIAPKGDANNKTVWN